MSVELGGSKSNGTAFLVSAGIVFEIIAAACSSPQTAEINADKRADTLMKWVNVGVGTAALFVALASVIDEPHRKEILGGGLLAGSLMYGFYVHAKDSGLKNRGPGTES